MRCKFGAFDAALEGIEALEERMTQWGGWGGVMAGCLCPLVIMVYELKGWQKSFSRCFFVHWESSSSKIPDPVFMSKIRRILSGIRCVNPPLPTDRWSPGWLKKKLETGPKCRRCSFPSQEPDFWANQTWSDRPPFILLCFIASAFRPYQQLSTRFASWLICKKISRLWHSFMWSPCSLHSITCF